MQPLEQSQFSQQMDFPLRVIMVEYLSPHAQFTERAIRFLFNDGMVLIVVKTGIEGLMEQPLMAKYEPLISNLIFNEQEHWYSDKPPMLTTKLFL